jgi:hypothetical protein
MFLLENKKKVLSTESIMVPVRRVWCSICGHFKDQKSRLLQSIGICSSAFQLLLAVHYTWYKSLFFTSDQVFTVYVLWRFWMFFGQWKTWHLLMITENRNLGTKWRETVLKKWRSYLGLVLLFMVDVQAFFVFPPHCFYSMPTFIREESLDSNLF